MGRFLRKRHVGGHDKERHSPYPIPQGRTARTYVTLHGRQSRRAVPQGRTARRSVPTSEVIGLHPGYIRVASLRKLHPFNDLHRIRLQSPNVDDPQGITTRRSTTSPGYSVRLAGKETRTGSPFSVALPPELPPTGRPEVLGKSVDEMGSN